MNCEPILCQFFCRYLVDEDTATFIKSVSECYTTSALERLVTRGSRQVRRGAVLALSLVGSFRNNLTVGQALQDSDRGVRVLAESGIQQLWQRDGSPEQQHGLLLLVQLNRSAQYEGVVQESGKLLAQAPRFAEAWNQRAIARYHLTAYRESVEDCRRTLLWNPYHFGAAIGMGNGFLELGRSRRALRCFRRALNIYPDLEGVRVQIHQLERLIDGS